MASRVLTYADLAAMTQIGWLPTENYTIHSRCPAMAIGRIVSLHAKVRR